VQKQAIQTDRAPAAIGAYSQAVALGDLLFVSGQLPLDPASGRFAGDDIESQTRQVLANIAATLAEAGRAPTDVVKVEIFLADMNDFATVNELYGAFFDRGVLPARQVVEVARLPKDARIEVSCIAAPAQAAG